jgi:predicted nucleic acid-binding protein
LIILDASAVVDLLLGVAPRAEAIAARLQSESDGLAAPHLLDVEIAQVVRRFVLRSEITPERARLALDDLLALPIHRYPHHELLDRAFELRENATMFDAVYLVLAEALNAPLLTCDSALAAIPGHNATVEVV